MLSALPASRIEASMFTRAWRQRWENWRAIKFKRRVYDERRRFQVMTDEQLLERITLNPEVMVGKPIIKGTRLTVEFILNLLAHGATITEIIEEYGGLTEEDIQACLLFAKNSLEQTAFMPLIAETR
jgi:uncharacterized protein (DUF433 family)